MEQNPYKKQFPELMRGKRIMYVHGFASSAQSGTVGRLRETFPEADVVAFDLPVDPHEALALLKKKIDVKYARFCQVFTDSMELGEYISDQEQDYDFSVIDSCLDYLLSLKIRPCFCMQLTTNSIVDPYRNIRTEAVRVTEEIINEEYGRLIIERRDIRAHSRNHHQIRTVLDNL